MVEGARGHDLLHLCEPQSVKRENKTKQKQRGKKTYLLQKKHLLALQIYSFRKKENECVHITHLDVCAFSALR